MKSIFIFSLMISVITARAQKEIPLYGVIPNSKPAENLEKGETDENGILRISNVSIPTLTIYQPQKSNGTAIIICPGGGYKILAASHEGSDVAKILNEWGVTAFVLKYRIPDDRTMLDKSIAPLQDAERAMQIIRENAKAWSINTKKIGIMGFSAGGHLAASLSTRYQEALITNPSKISFRPDFSVLVYPVISFTDSIGHKGSRENLIGKKASEFKLKKYSNELNVNKKTPPAFLVHAKDDKGVSYKNSEIYAAALRANNIKTNEYYYDHGGHGFGMNNKTSEVKWMDELKKWLSELKFL